jgi:hypothetical protein
MQTNIHNINVATIESANLSIVRNAQDMTQKKNEKQGATIKSINPVVRVKYVKRGMGGYQGL